MARKKRMDKKGNAKATIDLLGKDTIAAGLFALKRGMQSVGELSATTRKARKWFR